MVKWRGLNKMYTTTYIMCSFLLAIRPHVCGSWDIIKKKKSKKILQCPTIKSLSLAFGIGF